MDRKGDKLNTELMRSYKVETDQGLVPWTCQYLLANWRHGILQTRRAMRGIPVLSLGVNKQTIRGSQLAYRHGSDKGKEGGMEVETGRVGMK